MNLPLVKMEFTWDESFYLMRAVERSLVSLESNQDAIAEHGTKDDVAFWKQRIAENRALLAKVEEFRRVAI